MLNSHAAQDQAGFETEIVSGKSWWDCQHLQPSVKVLMLQNKASTVVSLQLASCS